MEVDYLKFFFALVLVIGVIVLLPMLARKYGRLPNFSGGGGARRLAVVETLALDARRRLVLIRRDQREYLLLLGQSSEIVVDNAGTADNANRQDADQQSLGAALAAPNPANNISRLSAWLQRREDRS